MGGDDEIVKGYVLFFAILGAPVAARLRSERNDFGRQFSGLGDEQASLKYLSIPSLNELRRMLLIEATKAATVHAENA